MLRFPEKYEEREASEPASRNIVKIKNKMMR
jgi:hypothetical protein